MDGTLVDTEPYWIRCQKGLVDAFGGTWTDDDAKALVGQALPFSASLLQQAGVDLTVREIIDRLITQVAALVRDQTPWRPGAKQLLSALRSEGVPCALVTMSEPGLADVIAASLPAGTFDVVVTGDMVSRGKPDPEPYLQAMERMGRLVPGLDPQRCVAIEDSLPGVRSARAAGLPTLAVPHFVPLPAGAAEHTRSSLAGTTPADLAALTAPAEPAAPAEADSIR